MTTRADLRDAAWVVLAKAAMGGVVLAGGFRAVSDDDFARVVHAQQFALAPALDPTGTSWLPLPFWLTGGAMMVFGTSITVARVVAFVTGVLASLLLLVAARLFIEDRRTALVGALCASLFPWSARLGVATVPELLAGALSVVALATLAREAPRIRLWGAGCLVAATLCRYEPWIVAIAFAAFTARDAHAARAGRSRGTFALAAVAAGVGPCSWIVHNAYRHGDALSFLSRVSAYKKAVSGAPTDVVSLLAGYPLALLREEPELCILAGGLVAFGRRVPPRFVRAGIAVGALLVLLTLASASGGAPTHHVGRAVLVIWLVLAIALGQGAVLALRSPGRRTFAAAVLVVMPLGAFILRPWYARLDSFVTRRDELSIGAAVTPFLAHERALVEARDYGFFAIQAGTGNPWRVVLDRSVDPRDTSRTSSFVSARRIEARAKEVDASLVLGHLSPATRELGAPLATAGPWGVWRLSERAPQATR